PHYPAFHEFNPSIRSHTRPRWRRLILFSLGHSRVMLRWILSLFAVMLASAGATKTSPARPDSTKECVFVLHGLAHGPASMETLAARLSRAGYVVYNLAYPSTKGSFPEMVAVLARAVDAHRDQHGKVHFVAFSLGALVVREYLGEASLPR